MSQLTYEAVNAAIAARCPKAELIWDRRGYHYFAGPGDVVFGVVEVNSLNQLTLEQWLEALERVLVKLEGRRAKSRVTTKQVNAALAKAGLEVELVKDRQQGYFYFSGPGVDLAFEQGVYGVWRLGDLSVEQWVEEAREKCGKGKAE